MRDMKHLGYLDDGLPSHRKATGQIRAFFIGAALVEMVNLALRYL